MAQPTATLYKGTSLFFFVDHVLSNKLPFKNNLTITPFSCSFPSILYGWYVHRFNQLQTCVVFAETSYWEAYWENTSHPIIWLLLLDTISVGNFHMWGSLTNSIWCLFDKDYPRPRHSPHYLPDVSDRLALALSCLLGSTALSLSKPLLLSTYAGNLPTSVPCSCVIFHI